MIEKHIAGATHFNTEMNSIRDGTLESQGLEYNMYDPQKFNYNLNFEWVPILQIPSQSS